LREAKNGHATEQDEDRKNNDPAGNRFHWLKFSVGGWSSAFLFPGTTTTSFPPQHNRKVSAALVLALVRGVGLLLSWLGHEC
jgi:GH18 family chitinase